MSICRHAFAATIAAAAVLATCVRGETLAAEPVVGSEPTLIISTPEGLAAIAKNLAGGTLVFPRTAGSDRFYKLSVFMP